MYQEKINELANKIVVEAKRKFVVITTAESCTGGFIASAITEISGASEVFDSAIVSYSNDSKKRFLNVQKETLEKFGAVSEETAREMSWGLMSNSNATISLSVTGIAGPTGATESKPIGLVYMALAEKLTGRNKSYQFNFNGDRAQIRLQATLKALELILEYIERK
jgi:nicotinamide-nucleotide amidase